MAGFLQGGGVGKTLAEWMIHGEPEADAWPMDVARYGDYAQNKRYIRETTGQFYTRPLRDDLSQRAASGGAAAQDGPGA